MDSTKIKPIEYNGQRVAPTIYLVDFVSNEQDRWNAKTSINEHARRMVAGVDVFSLKGRDFAEFIKKYSAILSPLGRGINLFTESGVLKLSQFSRFKSLAVFAEKYFGAEEPVIAPLATPIESTADVTALTPVEWSSQRVLTSEQLAQFYECDTSNIKVNFNANKEKFVEGKHYFKLEGDDLNNLRVSETYLQISPMTRALYLWTERGAARHAKMLSTEKAWQVFELLEENYFSGAKVVKVQPAKPAIKPAEIIREVGATSDAIQRVYKVKDGIALAQATDMVEQYYGQNLSSLKKLIPPAEHVTAYLNATELGQKLGMLGRATNNHLEVLKWQWKDKNGDWRLTDEGRKYGEEMPYMRNGHSGYQIRWSEKAVEFLTEATPSLFN